MNLKTRIVKSAAAVASGDGLCVGTIYPAKSMILRNHIGEAKSGKLGYEMSTTMAGQPIILSKQTGKWFTLSWQTIIDLAVKAGIDA